MSFGEEETKVETCFGQILGPTFSLCFFLVCCANSITPVYAIVAEPLLHPSSFGCSLRTGLLHKRAKLQT